MSTLPTPIIRASISISLIALTIVTYEGLRMLIKSRRRTRRAQSSSVGTRRLSLGPGDDEEEDSDDEAYVPEDNATIDEAASQTGEIRMGKDGRPTSGLVRTKLIVQDGRMPDAQINTYLSTLLDHLKERTRHHLGYPYNLSFQSNNLVPFLQYSINNLGDPFVPSNYGVHSRDFEIAVLDFFAKLYNIPLDKYWGYCTCSGTEGNLCGILYGREKFKPERNAVVYCSKDTHYSIPKAAMMYRMDLEFIDSDDTGEMIYSDLEKKISKHLDRPMVINVNVGTTVKGQSDTVDEVLAVLKKLNVPRERFYIHVDGALSGVVLPFVSTRCENKRVTFDKPIDSVSVSGHKMLGTPMPSGVLICRAEHSKRFAQDVEYLNSTDTTIMGSRNGQAAIAMWVALQRKGVDGLRADVVQCVDNAKYLKELFDASGIPAWLNDFSTTVTFARPPEHVVQKWQLACKGDIAHVVVMPSVHKKKLRQFHLEVCNARTEPHRGNTPMPPGSNTLLFTGGG